MRKVVAFSLLCFACSATTIIDQTIAPSDAGSSNAVNVSEAGIETSSTPSTVEDSGLRDTGGSSSPDGSLPPAKCYFDTRSTDGTSDTCTILGSESCPTACGGGTAYLCSGDFTIQPPGLTCRVLQAGDAGYPTTCCVENQCVRFATIDTYCKQQKFGEFGYSCPSGAPAPHGCTSIDAYRACCSP